MKPIATIALNGSILLIGPGTSLTLLSMSALITWMLLRGRVRARQYRQLAGELGFTYCGGTLPDTLHLSKASFCNPWDLATNVIVGALEGVDTVLFRFHANHGDVGYKQTVVAMKSTVPIVELSSLWRASGIHTEKIDDWILMFRAREEVPVVELRSFLENCRTLLQYFVDRQANIVHM
jgi:hypothetical protein